MNKPIKPADPADPTPSVDKPDESIHTDLPQVDTPLPGEPDDAPVTNDDPNFQPGEEPLPPPSPKKRETLSLPVKK